MINIQNVTKFYGETLAVDGISLEVPKGQILGFIGPNGAGKTTTLKMITGYLLPSEGEILIDGKSVYDYPEENKSIIGYLPEHTPLYGDMNVVEFLQFVADLRNIPQRKWKKRISEVISLCGLTEMAYKDIRELSKGYRQRVGLAQAIIHDPKILILDELTVGLDPNQIIDIRNLIKELGTEKTVILSTHIMQEVEAVCDRIVIINRGQIVRDGTLEELRHQYSGNWKINLEVRLPDNEPDFNGLLELEGIKKVLEITHREDSGTYVVQLETVAEELIKEDISSYAAGQGWNIIELFKEIVNLEDVFHEATLAKAKTGGEE